jgi:hypothetical protein
MKRIACLIAILSLGALAPIASASPDSTDAPRPRIGGAEVIYLVADNSGIHSAPNNPAFWYAGTSGVASD